MILIQPPSWLSVTPIALACDNRLRTNHVKQASYSVATRYDFTRFIHSSFIRNIDGSLDRRALVVVAHHVDDELGELHAGALDVAWVAGIAAVNLNPALEAAVAVNNSLLDVVERKVGT